MIRLTLATALTLAVLLLCGDPPRIQAQGNTKIVIKDGDSLVLRADGLDAGTNWSFSRAEVRHKNTNGVLTGLQITEAGADRCAGDPKCGVDPTKPWKIHLTYGAGTVTIASVSAHKGVHLTHSKIPFDQWQRTANADEREFGHGDGRRISSIKVNDGDSLCSGYGCEITVLFSPR
ncbi:MAG: hypothetical protein ABSH47_00580 [Bryobacteraceae bacterium]|jgi:hypothetical protein